MIALQAVIAIIEFPSKLYVQFIAIFHGGDGCRSQTANRLFQRKSNIPDWSMNYVQRKYGMSAPPERERVRRPCGPRERGRRKIGSTRTREGSLSQYGFVRRCAWIASTVCARNARQCATARVRKNGRHFDKLLRARRPPNSACRSVSARVSVPV